MRNVEGELTQEATVKKYLTVLQKDRLESDFDKTVKQPTDGKRGKKK
ncbi:MAG: hypothetical protein RBS57_05160 [Desulforhabdus sp.]|nr:hypothetical protein [Desulforhabdus sp.]